MFFQLHILNFYVKYFYIFELCKSIIKLKKRKKIPRLVTFYLALED